MILTINTDKILGKLKGVFIRKPSLKDTVDELTKIVQEMKKARELEEAEKAKEG